MSNCLNLNEIVKNFQTDASMANDPVKRMFICDMESMTANIASSSGDGSKLHTQPDYESPRVSGIPGAIHYDEIVIVIDGEAEFRVGDEVYRIGPGDFVFIPRNTLHGRVRTITESMSALSIYSPFFDRTKENIVWEKDS